MCLIREAALEAMREAGRPEAELALVREAHMIVWNQVRANNVIAVYVNEGDEEPVEIRLPVRRRHLSVIR